MKKNATITQSNIDIIARLRDRAAEGGGAEQRLIETILSDLHFATQAPIAYVAKRAKVSEPTVTRLARSLGFPGTRDMKMHLAQALAIGGAYLRGTQTSRVEASEGAQAVAAVCGGGHAALDLVSLTLAKTDIKSIAEIVARASQVMIYGTGGSSSMAAVELQNRLFRLGIQATAYTDPQMQRMSASVARKGSVIIAFSISGQVRSIVDAATIGTQYNARVVAVTSPDSPLAKVSDRLLPFVFKEDGNLYKPSATRYALLATVDILAMSIARAIGPEVLESLRRARQSLVTQDITDPDYPIGD